jgi:hypothetical protein
MKRKKLLIILGSGSSIPLGLPSVPSIDEEMKVWAAGWASERGCQDYFLELWKAIDAYYAGGHSRVGPALNFEKTLGEMILLSHWMTPAPWGDTLRKIACDGTVPPNLTFPTHPFHDVVPYNAMITVMDQYNHLLEKLAKHMRIKSKKIDSHSDAVKDYAALISGLRVSFDTGIYNLNYDSAALEAWPEAYTGFSEDGSFEPELIHQRVDWDFLYHLHGSVHHSLRHPHGGGICWRKDLNQDNFFDTPVNSTNDRRSEGRAFSRGTLIAGGYKLDQLLVEPFHSLHASLVRHIYSADAFLLGGYGFTDVHINRALQNRWGSFSEKPPVMVLDIARDNTDPMTFREDLWAYDLCSSLGAVKDFFHALGHTSPPVPIELAESGSFEINPQHRISIWYGGFTKAAASLERIVPWLNGGKNDVLRPQGR